MANVGTDRGQGGGGQGGGRPGRPQAPWPVRTGVSPPLAAGFVTRPETAPSPAAALIPGAVVALVSGRAGEPCGTTQLAVWCAESLWWSREVDLLAWVTATSRASVLAGYTQAAAAVGIEVAGTAEQVAARFTG